MTRFLHITDLHVSAGTGGQSSRRRASVAALERLVEIADRLRPRPAFIVASGDLTNTGDQDSYRIVGNMLGALDIPVIWALGNHDRRAGFHAVFPGHAGAPDGPLDHDAVHAGVHVIALDSSIPGQVGGGLDDDQFARLEEMLARHEDLPRLVTVHHPPKLSPGARNGWATLTEESSERLRVALAGRNVLAVLSGHMHMNRIAMWHGIPLVVTMGQQSTVDLTRTDALAVIEGMGFAICDLLPGGLQTTFVPLAEPRVIREIPEERLRAFFS